MIRGSYKVSLHDSVNVPNVEGAADSVKDPIQTIHKINGKTLTTPPITLVNEDLNSVYASLKDRDNKPFFAHVRHLVSPG